MRNKRLRQSALKQQVSPGGFFSSELGRKCSDGSSEHNSRLSPLRRGKQQRFQPSSCPKSSYRCGVGFFWGGGLLPDPPQRDLWRGSDGGRAAAEAFIQGRRSGLVFGEKMWKMSKICVAAVSKPRAATVRVRSEHPVAASGHGRVCVCEETHDLTLHGRKSEHRHFSSTPQQKSTLRIPATANETYLVIDISFKNVPCSR